MMNVGAGLQPSEIEVLQAVCDDYERLYWWVPFPKLKISFH